MANITVSTDIDTLLQSADNAAALSNLGVTLDSITDNGSTTTNNVTVGSKFATGNNVATGGTSIAIGGSGNVASGSNSEVLGSDNSTASSQGATIVGGSNNANAGTWSSTLGGLNQSVAANANRSAIIAGFSHNMNHTDSVILGGSGITTDSNGTVFVDTLDVKRSVYISQITAADPDKSGKCQLWVNATGDLYLTLPNGTDRQIAFV